MKLEKSVKIHELPGEDFLLFESEVRNFIIIICFKLHQHAVLACG